MSCNALALTAAYAPHECGHIVVLFAKNKAQITSKGLVFYPRKLALDGSQGVTEVTTTELTADDCTALAASAVGELLYTGRYDGDRVLDDRNVIENLSGQPLENFILEAYATIQENLLFFNLLVLRVSSKMVLLFGHVCSIPVERWNELPETMPVLTFDEIKQTYEQAQSILKNFLPHAE